ncbi:MAG: DNA-binding protein [Candidatus Thermoplasmatota archaeon]|jgi:hypothetical protein
MTIDIDALPTGLGAPADKALGQARITSLSQLSKYSEREIRALHGMGPTAVGKLRIALAKRGLEFAAV